MYLPIWLQKKWGDFQSYGGFYNFDQHNHLLFSAGKGLQNAAETNRVSTYIGYQYTL